MSMDDDDPTFALNKIANALSRIANGDVHGPTGLELVSMSVAKSDEPSLAMAIENLASSIHDGLESIATAIDRAGTPQYPLHIQGLIQEVSE